MSTPAFGPGIEITGRITPEYAADPDARGRRVRRQAAAHVRRPPRRVAGAARARARPSSTPASCPISSPRRARCARATGPARRCRPTSRTAASRSPGPVDRKMVINALNSGANVFMADFEDANTPRWDNNIQGHINLRDAIRRRIDCVSPEGKAYKLNDKVATLFVRPRGWHLPEKHVKIDGAPVSGGIFDFALYFFHNAKELVARGSGPVLLPAEAREPPRSAAVERHLRDGAGRPRHSARHDQGHGADRDDPRRLRDGRDPVRAARAFGRAQRRPLGLHLQLHQEVPHQQGLLPRRPRAGHDDHALPQELRRAADQDLPSPQHPRDGRHGGADPGEERREGECGGFREGEGRQGARSHVRSRRHVGRASGAGAGGARGVQPPDAHAEPDRPEEARRREGGRCRPRALRAGAADHGEGAAPQHQRGDPVHRRVARRAGRGADLQPDGGRGDRRDLALAGVAVDALAEGRARRRPQGDQGDGRDDDSRGNGEDPRPARRRLAARASTTMRRRSSPTSSTTTRSSSSSRCRRTSGSTERARASRRGPAD